MTPETQKSHWIDRIAEREKERRADAEIVRAATVRFRADLQGKIEKDLERYFRHFPEDRECVNWVSDDGDTFSAVIRKCDGTGASYIPPVKVRIRFDVDGMMLECQFTTDSQHKRSGSFAMAHQPNGSVGLADGRSAADVSRYILEPILFPKLTVE
jgi:hypothetical protein